MKQYGCDCRDADLLLVANKGGFAFAVDPDTGERVWATAVGKKPKHVPHCFMHVHLWDCQLLCGWRSSCHPSMPIMSSHLTHIYTVKTE